MKKYIICDLRGGCWSESHGGFKGELFATKYDTLQEAEQNIPNARKFTKLFLEIKTIYCE